MNDRDPGPIAREFDRLREAVERATHLAAQLAQVLEPVLAPEKPAPADVAATPQPAAVAPMAHGLAGVAYSVEAMGDHLADLAQRVQL